MAAWSIRVSLHEIRGALVAFWKCNVASGSMVEEVGSFLALRLDARGRMFAL
jgi:hypothetical protein